MKIEIKKYKLSGGSKVSVFKPFGKRFYFAIVDMRGDYPGEGKIAHNKGRNELVFVLNGKIKVIKNGKTKSLTEGKNVVLEDGCRYEISGKGKSLVFVDDGEKASGKSLIETKQ